MKNLYHPRANQKETCVKDLDIYQMEISSDFLFVVILKILRSLYSIRQVPKVIFNFFYCSLLKHKSNFLRWMTRKKTRCDRQGRMLGSVTQPKGIFVTFFSCSILKLTPRCVRGIRYHQWWFDILYSRWKTCEIYFTLFIRVDFLCIVLQNFHFASSLF